MALAAFPRCWWMPQTDSLEEWTARRESPGSSPGNPERTSRQKDVPALRHFCVTKLGLVSDDLRAQAWPLLLGVDPAHYMQDWKSLEPREHRDSHQISLDCMRSFYNYDVLTGLSPRLRDRKIAELERILNMVLQTLPNLYYNQGFHDICTVLLLVCGEDLAFKLAHKMAQSHYRECMREDFSGVVKQMDLVYPLVGQYDPQLEDKLREISPQPAVALPFIITGFQHDINSYEMATRVFDFILAAHPAASIYMSTALLQSQREDILYACDDMAALHTHVKAVFDFLDFDALCGNSFQMMGQLPPAVLLSLCEDGKGFLEDSPMNSPDVAAEPPKPKLSRLSEVIALAFPALIVLASSI